MYKRQNPCFIPRNHIIEDALQNAEDGDMSLTNKILELFKNPFSEQDNTESFQNPSEIDTPYVTFCGT